MAGESFILMGVSGSGKTLIGSKVAALLSAKFIDGDDLHPAKNIDKMSQGIPLSDEDRLPWLERLNDASYSLYKKNETGFIVCSSLKKQYRDILRKGSPHVHFLWLDGDYETILARMQRRAGHFMPVALLKVSLRHWSVHKQMNRILCALISTMILPMSPNNVGRLCWRYDKTEYVRKRAAPQISAANDFQKSAFNTTR